MDRIVIVALLLMCVLITALIMMPHPAALPQTPTEPARQTGAESGQHPGAPADAGGSGLVADEGGPPTCRLAVMLIFDQLCACYLENWLDLYEKDGFRRLQEEGTWFKNCNYPYSDTVTAAGHATLLTGCSPRTHGIIGNVWHDRRSGKEVYCVEVERYALVPPSAEKGAGKRGNVPAAPDYLLVPTVGDSLKKETNGKGRVVSLSLKDRSAVLPGGRLADVCYWMAPTTGDFITSTFYRDAPHPWIAEFNRKHLPNQWFDKDWVRLLPDLDYARYSSKDDAPGEGIGEKQGTTFPHPMTGGLKQPGKAYYDAVYTSPYGNELLSDLARLAIDRERLGADNIPDLLCLSFSSNDAVGHVWGPDSQEVLDITLRSDRLVRDLLRLLDEKVGKGRYVVVLSADHGVCSLPETLRARGIAAGRIDEKELLAGIEAFLSTRYGKVGEKERWIEAFASPSLYLNHKLLKARRLQPREIEDAVAGFMRKQPYIERAYTRTQLLAPPEANDSFGQAVRRSFFPDRSGDVMLVSKPHFFTTKYLTGTTHGTPHPYDKHVPLLVYGTDIPARISDEAVTPQAAALILARALHVSPPSGAEVPLPQTLAQK